jgi:hypothetical protein
MTTDLTTDSTCTKPCLKSKVDMIGRFKVLVVTDEEVDRLNQIRLFVYIYLPMTLPLNTSPHRNTASSMHGSPFSVAGMSTSGSAHHHNPSFGGWGSASVNPSGSLTSFSDSLSQSRSQYQPGYLMVRVGLCFREYVTYMMLSQHHRTLLVLFFELKRVTCGVNTRSWLSL